MTKNFYDLLGIAATAPPDEIKRAFRREIAKYHPDKVQHLGLEFQEIAAVKTAELTRAYKMLSDESLRADYDADLAAGRETAGRAAAATDPPSSQAAGPARPPAAPAPDPPSAGRATVSPDRAGVSDLVRRAALGRFRQALDAEFGRCDETPVQGFEITCAPLKGRFWSKLPPRILARFVAHVDAAAVSESWAMTSRITRDDQRDVCVFVMGPSVAPAAELARAIAEERRRPMPGGVKLTLVPVNTKIWLAHIPNDAPPVVKLLVTRLKSS